MMSIKLGGLMDQPRHVRVQALANEQQRKAEAAKELAAKQERAKAEAAKHAALKALNEKVVQSLDWLWIAVASGKGPEKETRRYVRRPELKMLAQLAKGERDDLDYLRDRERRVGSGAIAE